MSLVAWYPLNGDTKNYASGPLGNLENTSTSTNTMTNDGKIGKTYTNTTNSAGALLSEGKVNLGTNQSMFCWLYMTDVYSSSSLNAIMGQHRFNYNSGKGMNMGLTVKYISSTTGYLSVNTATSGGRTYNTYTSSTLLSAGKWYHVGYTYDGSTICLYINGVLDKSHDFTGQVFAEDYFGAYMWSLNGTAIGTRSVYGGYNMKGKLNDIRIYNHTLSKKEVKEIYTHPIISYDFDRVFGNNILAGRKLTMGSLGTSVSNSTAPTFGSMKFTTAGSGTTRLPIPLDLLTASLVYRTSFIVQCPAGLTFNISDWCDSGTITNRATTTLGPDKYLVEADVTRASYDSTYRFFDFNASGAGTYEITGFQMCPLNMILDNSGFNNHGTMSAMSLNTTTDRGRYSGYFNGTTAYCEFDNLKSDMVSSDFSIAFGVYPSSNGKRNVFFGDHNLTNGVSFNVERTTSNYLRVYVGGNPDLNISACTITTGTWTHILITYNKTTKTLKVYKNGSCVYTNTSLDITLTKTVGSKFRLGRDNRSGSNASTTSETPFYGYMDYFHFYPVTLSDNDAVSLYKTRIQIAKNSSLFVDRIAEETTARDIVFDYKMNLNSQSPMEFDIKNKFDGNVYFEPDGSAWLRIVHHGNPAGGVFESSSDFTNSCYIDANRWFNAEVCDYLNSWELMIKQKVESSSSEVKYRWIQTKNPMTAVYGDVDAADITKITTTGYTSTSYGGIYKNTGGKTFLSANNGTASNWYGAFGSYTPYNGGTPGWNGTVVTSGYMDLYVRIDNTTISNLRRDASGDSESGGTFKSFNKGTVYADNIIER